MAACNHVRVAAGVRWWALKAITPEGALLADLDGLPTATELLPRLPEGCMLQVGSCEPPRMRHEEASGTRDATPQIVLRADELQKAMGTAA